MDYAQTLVADSFLLKSFLIFNLNHHFKNLIIKSGSLIGSCIILFCHKIQYKLLRETTKEPGVR